MAKVYSWQLGRNMDYPYEGKYPERQFAAVFNINRCIACQTCTMACKSTWTFSKGQEYMWWNNVETKPYGGYPQSWDIKILKLLREAHDRQGREMSWNSAGEYEGMTIFEAARLEHTENGQSRVLGYLPEDREWTKPNIGEDTSPPSTAKKDSMAILRTPSDCRSTNHTSSICSGSATIALTLLAWRLARGTPSTSDRRMGWC